MWLRDGIHALKRNPLFLIKLVGARARAQGFIGYLTGINEGEIKSYSKEIRSDNKFQSHLKENLSHFPYTGSLEEMSPIFGLILYVIARSLKPKVVVETGVASGVSSSYILCALERNQHGRLYSIDLPPLHRRMPYGKQSGWIIPDYLRGRWELTIGRTRDKLSPLLRGLGMIDIFMHDSEHSYENMLFEYQTAWPFLKSGGILLSHDITVNNAFTDFRKSIESESFVFSYVFNAMGGVVKIA